MLRRIDGRQLLWTKKAFSRKGWTRFTGSGRFVQIALETRQEYEVRCQGRPRTAVLVWREQERNYWQFGDKFFWENDGLDSEAVSALLIAREKRQAAQVERAKQIARLGDPLADRPSRMGIPDEVKKYVWMRDGGRCLGCGSSVNLQFDHIIPVAMGGSSTAENLQLLCSDCNRRKGAGLALE